MKRVLLMCLSGFSSATLVERIKKAALKIGIDIEVETKGKRSEAFLPLDKAFQPDVIMISPTIRHHKEIIANENPTVPVKVMDMQAYGTNNGDVILEQVLELIKGK